MDHASDARIPTDADKVSPAADSGPPSLQLSTRDYLLLAIVAGTLFFGVYYTVVPIYEVPEHLLRMFPTDEDAVKREIEKNWARAFHATTGIGLFGLLLGGLMSAGESLTRRFQVLTVLAAALLTAVFGCLGGLFGSLLIIRLERVEAISPMARTIMGHTVMLGLLGFGVGAALGLVLKHKQVMASCAMAGFFAGTLAAVLFPIACGFLLPNVPADSVIPDGSGGVFGIVKRQGTIGVAVWIGFASVAMGLIRTLVGRRRPRSPSGRRLIC